MNTMMLNGDFKLTDKWKIQYSTNLDLRARKLALSSFTIYRDLHCWDLNMQWVPFGPYKSYNVTLRVKAAVLQDFEAQQKEQTILVIHHLINKNACRNNYYRRRNTYRTNC